ncbi:MAG: aldo/keto reductase [Eubacteriales bacterium]|nr:aldo/keto reductase [Eubacteriales bacterium]
MEMVKLGNSNLMVSRMTLGCWSFGGGSNSYWGKQEAKESEALLHAAVDMGVNYYDTAFVYNDGESEKALGDIISHGLREKMIICNKIPQLSYDELPKYEQMVHDSLSRLKTDYLDVLLMHWPCNDKDLLRANLEQLQKVKDKGLVREIGVSNFGVGQMIIVNEMGIDICVNELAYNVIHRGAELAIFPYTEKNNISVMAYMPLMQGILAGKYDSTDEIPPTRRRTIHFDSRKNDLIRHGGQGMEPEVQQFITDLKALSKETGISCSELCISWVLSNKAVSTILVGIRNIEQLKANVKAMEIKLPEDIIARLNDLSAPIAELCGPNCDFWQWNSRVW